MFETYIEISATDTVYNFDSQIVGSCHNNTCI